MICKTCSSTIPDGAAVCPICRSSVQQENSHYEQPQADYGNTQQYYAPQPQQNKPVTSTVWLYAVFALSALTGSVLSLVLAAIALILFERKVLFAERGDFMQVNYYVGLIRKLGIAAWVLFALQAVLIIASIAILPMLVVLSEEFFYDDYYYYGIMSALM